MSEEELREIVLAHESLPEDERRILDDVFAAGDRSLAEAMTPRGEVAFLAADTPLADAAQTVAAGPYSRYPVTGDDFDDVVGFLHVRDLLGRTAPTTRRRTRRRGAPSPCATSRRPILALPATNTVLPAMSQMRREGVHIAVVVDEYGGTDGIVTLEDLVEELVGDIRDEYDADEPSPAREHGATTSVDAGQTIEEFARRTGVELPDGPYETVAGFVLAQLGRLAVVGDHVDADGYRLTVTDVARRRIVRVDVVRSPDRCAKGTVASRHLGRGRLPRPAVWVGPRSVGSMSAATTGTGSGIKVGVVGSFGSAAQVLEMAVGAEDAGWDGFFSWDGLSLLSMPVDTFDPWAVLAAAAVRTERITLGAMVFALPAASRGRSCARR